MDEIAKKRRLVNVWVCMKCNATMRSPKKPEFCRTCGSVRIRAKKKGKKV
jgi:ribosomal protein L40E